MALTTQNRSDIRKYLGYSQRFRQFFPVFGVEAAMDQLDAFTATGDTTEQVKVLAIVTALAAIDVQITAAYPLLIATQAGSTHVAAAMQIDWLRSEGRRLVGNLSAALDVAVNHDFYSASAPENVTSSAGGGGANYMPQG